MYYVWDAFEISRHVILDADTAELKAHISTGIMVTALPSKDGSELYVSDTLSLGPRRLRKDYLNVYDTTDYSLSRSLELPENRRALMGPMPRAALRGSACGRPAGFPAGSSAPDRSRGRPRHRGALRA